MKRIYKTVLAILTLIICIVTGYNYFAVDIHENKNMFRLNSYNATGTFEILSTNTAKCDLSTFSNTVLAMEEDGYIIKEEKCTADSIDLVLIRKSETIRLVYKKTGGLTSIASPYEKSYIPLTYINERVVQNEKN